MSAGRPPGTGHSLVGRMYRHSAVRYLFIGGVSFLVDFGILAMLHTLFGVPVWLATAISFLASFAFNYSLQRAFSFSSQASHGRTLAKYVALVAFNTAATVLIVAALDASALGWGGGKVAATVVTTVWNYFAYRYWVFVDAPKQGEHNEAHVVIGQVVDDPEHASARKDEI
jgi:putative flippase GtrA